LSQRSIKERLEGVSFGWYTVLAGAIISCWGCMSALFNPLIAEHGWTYDVTGSYTNAFVIIAGLQALAIVFKFFTKKPKPPVEAETLPQFHS
jgi:hypothetical protein